MLYVALVLWLFPELVESVLKDWLGDPQGFLESEDFSSPDRIPTCASGFLYGAAVFARESNGNCLGRGISLRKSWLCSGCRRYGRDDRQGQRGPRGRRRRHTWRRAGHRPAAPHRRRRARERWAGAGADELDARRQLIGQHEAGRGDGPVVGAHHGPGECGTGTDDVVRDRLDDPEVGRLRRGRYRWYDDRGRIAAVEHDVRLVLGIGVVAGIVGQRRGCVALG